MEASSQCAQVACLDAANCDVQAVAGYLLGTFADVRVEVLSCMVLWGVGLGQAQVKPPGMHGTSIVVVGLIIAAPFGTTRALFPLLLALAHVSVGEVLRSALIVVPLLLRNQDAAPKPARQIGR